LLRLRETTGSHRGTSYRSPECRLPVYHVSQWIIPTCGSGIDLWGAGGGQTVRGSTVPVIRISGGEHTRAHFRANYPVCPGAPPLYLSVDPAVPSGSSRERNVTGLTRVCLASRPGGIPLAAGAAGDGWVTAWTQWRCSVGTTRGPRHHGAPPLYPRGDPAVSSSSNRERNVTGLTRVCLASRSGGVPLTAGADGDGWVTACTQWRCSVGSTRVSRT
jgi:hypothetical protein